MVFFYNKKSMVAKIFISLLLGLLCFLNLQGQNHLKFEKEFSIRRQHLPEKADIFISPLLNDAKKIRFYKEYDLKTISYECKLKLENRKVSIEFDSAGSIMDVELLVTHSEINESIWLAIQNILKTDFKKHKITRIQKQFSNKELRADGASYIFNIVKPHADMPCNYEIVVEGNKDGQFLTFEYLFSHTAQVLSKKQIIKPDDTNILY